MRKRLAVLLLLALALAGGAGCKSPSGDQEFIPGKGWQPVEPVD